MPVLEPKITADLYKLYNELAQIQNAPASARFKLAQGHAKIIAAAIRSATVIVNAGQAVATTGGAGATAAPGTGKLI